MFFCFECIGEHVKHSPKAAVVTCPTCQVKSLCSSPERMKRELYEPVTTVLIEIYENQPTALLRYSCSRECNSSAEYWCSKCEASLCGGCIEQHSAHRSTKSHKVNPIAQTKAQLSAECSFCKSKATRFCESCEKSVCYKCIFQGHKSHKLTEMAQQLKKRKEHFQRFVDDVKDHYKESQRRKRILYEEFQRIAGELRKEIKKSRILKTTTEKLSLVSEHINDEQVLEIDTNLKLEHELRKKLKLSEKYFRDSKVIDTAEDKRLVVGWLNEARGERNVNRIELLFRGTRDGFQSRQFHSRSDGQGPTVVLFKTNEGKRGGGYSALSWSSPQYGVCVEDPTKSSFLFSLEHREKYGYKGDTGRAIINHSGYGPVFGEGHDLRICSNCQTTNKNASCPQDYLFPSGNVMAGSHHFTIIEYEVWKVQ